MNPNKQKYQQLLRQLHLVGAADRVRFVLQWIKLYQKNRATRKEFPEFHFPPASLLYEIGGRLDLQAYRRGAESAEFIVQHFNRFSPEPPRRILDWGCGVSCVCRHLPAKVPSGAKVIGCDINSRMISWGQKHLQGIEFHHSDLRPPLPLEDHRTDWVYALSVITHLDQPTILAWLEEMKRVLRPNGIFLITTNGSNIESALLPQEKGKYFEEGFVIREGVEEGRKMYLAFHEPASFRKLLTPDWEVLDFSPAGMLFSGQDMWTLRPR